RQMKPLWKQGHLFWDQNDLESEWRQCTQEGRETASVEEEFARLRDADLDADENQQAVNLLFDRTIRLPFRSGYEFNEPSDLREIRAVRPAQTVKVPPPPPADEKLLNKIHGAWLGRAAGCLLGKPVECWHSERAW